MSNARRNPLLPVLASLLVALGCACSSAGPPAAPPAPVPVGPVVLVGLDGIEWNLALTMLEQGRLPHLAALMERGQYGTLETLIPTVSPAIWTTVATGVSPEVHGITGFKTSKRKDARLVNAADRKARAFWEILGDHGRRSATVGWWLTWPVEPVDGVLVAQVNLSAPDKQGTSTRTGKGALFEGMERQVHPEERQAEFLDLAQQVSDGLSEQLEALFGRPWDESLGPVAQRLWASSLWALRGDAIYRAVALELLQEEQSYDLLALYISGTDVVGHRFWRYLHPGGYESPPSEAEVAALGDYVPAYYAWADSVVGEVVAAAPLDATVIVVSDHGMKRINKRAAFQGDDPNGKLISAGHPNGIPCFFVAAGPAIRSTGQGPPSRRAQLDELGSVYDLLPTVLALLEVPLAEDMPGEVMEGVLAPGFLDAHPTSTVPSHTPVAWLQRRGQQAPAVSLDEDRRSQLQALGYIE